jgi:hypothetical protein
MVLVPDYGPSLDLPLAKDGAISQPPPAPNPPALDLKSVTWLSSSTDVSGWPETVNLKSISYKSTQICLNYDTSQTAKWPTDGSGSDAVNANAWVFIWHNNKWYGGTFEWLRVGQTCKFLTSVAGDHLKGKPFDAASGWKPQKGQTLYFMISGFARMGKKNVQERSNYLKTTWP